MPSHLPLSRAGLLNNLSYHAILFKLKLKRIFCLKESSADLDFTDFIRLEFWSAVMVDNADTATKLKTNTHIISYGG